MQVIKLNSKNKQQLLKLAVLSLQQGKTLVYPTDTSYGLGAAAFNAKAIKKIYNIKGRKFNQPIHVLVPSLAAAKKIVKCNRTAEKLAKKFLPGRLSMALPLKSKKAQLIKLSAATNFLGIRIPKNEFAIALAKMFKAPITATSANPSAKSSSGYDSYSARDVLKQFRKRKYKPDIIIDAGTLPKNKPSTFIKISGDIVEILRPGPISKRQIQRTL
jgi:L-threonylcarbamoyladenylate synthase